jgi:insertion element IS1 protein InsB
VALPAIKNRKIWIIKAVDHGTGSIIAWVLSGRDAATCQRLYDNLTHLADCIFYTNHWDAFSHVLPKALPIMRKSQIHAIERDHSNTRHHLACLTRRTTVAPKGAALVHASLKLWCALTVPVMFEHYQQLCVSLFN